MAKSKAKDLKFKAVTITPELATKMLERNTNNRPIRASKVKQYSRALKNGQWEVNGEAIRLAKDGRILDGQHRLMGIIESDVAMETILIEGLDDSAQESMDQGTKRTLQDALKLRDEAYWPMLAAVIRAVYAWETTGIPVATGDMSVQEGIKILDRHPGIREAIKNTNHFGSFKWISRTQLASIYYLASQYSKADADVFLGMVRTGADLAENNPIWMLRYALISDLTQSSPRMRFNNRHKAALIIITWNHWITGEPLTRLSWKPGGANPSPFPHIYGVESPALQEAK